MAAFLSFKGAYNHTAHCCSHPPSSSHNNKSEALSKAGCHQHSSEAILHDYWWHDQQGAARGVKELGLLSHPGEPCKSLIWRCQDNMLCSSREIRGKPLVDGVGEANGAKKMVQQDVNGVKSDRRVRSSLAWRTHCPPVRDYCPLALDTCQVCPHPSSLYIGLDRWSPLSPPSPLPSTQTSYIWIQRTPTLECWNPTLSKEASSSLCWHPNSHNCKGPPSSSRLSQRSLSECWEEEGHCCSLQESVYTACSSNHQWCCGGCGEQHYIHRWAHWWTINIALLAVKTNQHLYFLNRRAGGAGCI